MRAATPSRGLTPTHAFHVVFTLPRQLRRLALANRKLVFDLLFASAAASLLELGRDPARLGADLGVTSVLHTWTRDLRFHPHVHCIVTGGGLSLDGQRWIAAPIDYLFPVRALGALFRGKVLDGLRRAHDEGKLRFDGPAAGFADRERFRRLCDQLYDTRWVVYCKPPFGDDSQVFGYLGQYTHRVGLSNHRLVSFDGREVTFRTRGPARVTLEADELLRRFVLHVLPKGFVKIRHHGLFAAGNVHAKPAVARRLLAIATTGDNDTPSVRRAPQDFREVLLGLTGIDLRRCDRCGELAVVRAPLDPPAGGGSEARAPPTSAYPCPDTS